MVTKIFQLKYNEGKLLEKKEESEIYNLTSLKELLTTSEEFLVSINDSQENYDCSVLISAYNGMKFIKEAILSVVLQVIEYKIETLVLLDKGTTDSILD